MNKQMYNSSDLGLVSLLRYSGCVPSSIINQNGKILFQFEKTKEMAQMADAYERGKIMRVDVNRLFLMLKDTKNVIFRKLKSIQ